MTVLKRKPFVRPPFRVLLFALFLVSVLTAGGSAESLVVTPGKKVVVLDPGHGRHDRGAIGVGGALEKEVTLNIAKRIAAELEGTYHVVLTRISELSDEYGLPVVNVFHAGDGNLHPLILYDANIEGELARTEELGGRILEICVESGGTITGEHGVGMEKINQMCVQFNSHELLQFHAIKQAFDPDELLNPGKAIPTLHRCAEFGAMHVHHGRLPHPELERF